MKLSNILTIILIIVLILAVIAFIGFATDSLYKKSYSTATGQTATDKFELFRDLLFVLLAFAAVIGAAMYHLVREYVKKDVMDEAKKDINEMTQSVRKEISRERGKNIFRAGAIYWEMGNIIKAIQKTEEALKEEGLEDWNVVKAKNNLAYYLASYYKATKVE